MIATLLFVFVLMLIACSALAILLKVTLGYEITLWPLGIPRWVGIYLGPLLALLLFATAIAYAMGSPSWGRRLAQWSAYVGAAFLGGWAGGRMVLGIQKLLP